MFSLGGVGVVPIPVGTYDVTFTRGIEWTIETDRVHVTRDGVQIHARLKHVVDTPHWLSADFHVHAAQLARLARADARPRLRVRLRRRRHDRLDRSQRRLELRADDLRAPRREVPRDRDGRRDHDRRLGPLRRLPAAPRDGVRGSRRDPGPPQDARRHLPLGPRDRAGARSSTSTTRASRPRPATSSSASSTTSPTAPAARASPTTSTPSRSSTATRTPTAARSIA